MAFGKIFFVTSTTGDMGVGGHFSGSDNRDIWQPAADLVEVEEGYLVQMDLPGVDAGSVEAIIDGQRLLVRGVRRGMRPARGKRYIHMEISRGEFGKEITLPEPVAEDRCRAVLRGGVLEIFLPFGTRSLVTVTAIRIATVS